VADQFFERPLIRNRPLGQRGLIETRGDAPNVARHFTQPSHQLAVRLVFI